VGRGNCESLFCAKAFDVFPPELKTEPGLVGALVDAVPPGPNTDPVGLATVDALPPEPKTDPVLEAGPPNGNPAVGCCTPNAEGWANADIVVSCAGAPKAEVVAVGVVPKEDCPNTDPPEGANGLSAAPDPNADGCPANAEKPTPDGELPLPKAEAPVPANALKAPPLAGEPKAPVGGLIIDELGCDANADVCCGWPKTDAVCVGWPNADVVAGELATCANAD